jgi:hypothetical protein
MEQPAMSRLMRATPRKRSIIHLIQAAALIYTAAR